MGWTPGVCAATTAASRSAIGALHVNRFMSVEYQLMTETTLPPSRLWRRMTSDQRQRAAHAFWSDPDATDDQVQAAFLIAQQKKFRPKTVIGLDLDRKAKHLATVPGVPDQIAARALATNHLAHHAPKGA